MMLRSIRVCLLTVGALAGPGQAQPNIEWLHQFGSAEDDAGLFLSPTGDGGAFVSGNTRGDFGGNGLGDQDVFLGRIDAAGNWVWVRHLGSSAYDSAGAVGSDGQGGVYFVGTTSGNMGGANKGLFDIFLSRYDGDGNQLWIKQLGTNSADTANGVLPDGAGGFFMSGYSEGSLGGQNGYGADAYLGRFDSTGKKLWLKQFGGSSFNSMSAIVSDGQGGVFFCGTTDEDLDGHYGLQDAFVGRYDGAGNLLWLDQFGTSKYEMVSGICADGAGGFIAAGSTDGSLGGTNSGGYDAWTAGYTAQGVRTWIKQFGTGAHDFVYDAVDAGGGRFYAVGLTQGSLGGNNAGGQDAFMVLCDDTGAREWSFQFGSPGNDYAVSVAPLASRVALIVGATTGDLDGENLGLSDGFIARLEDSCPADCDNNDVLDAFDFFCFVNMFNAVDPAADCDGTNELNVFDFFCFVNSFNLGC